MVEPTNVCMPFSSAVLLTEFDKVDDFIVDATPQPVLKTVTSFKCFKTSRFHFDVCRLFNRSLMTSQNMVRTRSGTRAEGLPITEQTDDKVESIHLKSEQKRK